MHLIVILLFFSSALAYSIKFPSKRHLLASTLAFYFQSNGALAIDAIDAKFLRRNQFEKKQSDAKHWDEIMIRRELNILKKFKAASTILMKEVNQSFHPLRSVIESALLVKQFSNKLVQKARDNMKVQ
jgi:hypothetical protein